MVRDQALALSGLLSRKTHGPSVHPPQPPGLWRAAFNGQRTWETSEGADRYRRGLYTFWRRTVSPANMFDAADRQACRVRSATTSTPLHALTTRSGPSPASASHARTARWTDRRRRDRSDVGSS